MTEGPEGHLYCQKRRISCKVLQVLFINIALNSALTAVTASAKHFGVKLIK